VIGVCPAVSPESGRPCVLPNAREYHSRGHESARVDVVRVVWGTTDEDADRWDEG